VNPTFFGTNKEEVIALPVEVEAKAASKTCQGRLVVFASCCAAGHELQLHDLLTFQLVLHQKPI